MYGNEVLGSWPFKIMDKYFLTVPSVEISYAIHGSNENLKQQSLLKLE